MKLFKNRWILGLFGGLMFALSALVQVSLFNRTYDNVWLELTIRLVIGFLFFSLLLPLIFQKEWENQ